MSGIHWPRLVFLTRDLSRFLCFYLEKAVYPAVKLPLIWYVLNAHVTSLDQMSIKKSRLIYMLFVPGYPSPHQCHLPPGVDRNITIPMDPETGQPSSCSVYVNVTVNNDTQTCPDGWDYYTQGETSIVTEVNYNVGILFMNTFRMFVSHMSMPCHANVFGSMACVEYTGYRWILITKEQSCKVLVFS